ncbi:MAG: molybdenum cofactor guanylyltransferase [Chloroflexi bacterium]|nr:molybdenum cofactor guanylyltransferase [Chloroflexota bacterium]
MTSIVLAGGRSTRLGRDKLVVEVGGRSLLQRVVDTVLPLSREVLIVKAPGQEPLSELHYSRLRWVQDERPERGSLVGVYSGLKEALDFHSLVVAGDMPFLHRGLLEYMISISPGFDVVLPRMGDWMEPLHAIYSQNCLPYIEELLGQGELKILEFLSQVKSRVGIRYLEEAEIDMFDSRHLCFFNINTEADLARARELEVEVGT